MKKGRGCGGVRGGGMDAIQSHEPWNYTTSTSVVGLLQQHSDPMISNTIITNTPFQFPDNNKCNFERSNDLSEWVEHVTRQLLEDLPEYSSHQLHSLQLTPSTTTTTTTCGNVLEVSHGQIQDPFSILAHEIRPRKALKRYSSAFPFDGTDNLNSNQLLGIQATHDGGASESSNEGLTLLSQLLECAVAISADNISEAHKMLLEMTHTASPYSPSCAERVVAYFTKAMSCRVINSCLGISSPLIDHKYIHSSFLLFNNVTPFVKFAHFTSNQAILEAFQRRDRVHIIDVDVMQGLQWPALFHILATRIEGPPHVRLTGMGSSMELLIETGKQLSDFTKRLGLSFEFIPIAKKFGHVEVSMIPLRRGETLAVHWSQHSLYDANGHDMKTMRLLQQLSPRVITLVEQDISHGGSFLDRFVSSLHYYSTVFDSLGACLPGDSETRQQVEHGLLYREINNILGIGGPSRSGEDKFRDWRSELQKSNAFVQLPMSINSMAQAHGIFNIFPPNHGYTLHQGHATLSLGWKHTSLFTASAWTCSHIFPSSR